MFRDVGGVTRSLEKAYLSGREWAGKTEEDRVKLWSEFYNNAQVLPDSRTCFVSYSDFIIDPNASIENLNGFLSKFNVDISDAQKSTLTTNHATGIAENKFTLREGQLLASEAQLEAISKERLYTQELRQHYPSVIKDAYNRLRD